MKLKTILVLACLLLATACQRKAKQSQAEGEVLATIGERKITTGEFAARLKTESPYIRAQFDSPERRRMFLDNWIQFELLAGEAKRLHLDEKPEVQQAMRVALAQALIKSEVEDKLQSSGVTDEEIKAYQESRPQDFNPQEQRLARQIVVANKTEAQSIIKSLQGLAHSQLGPKFVEITTAKSLDTATKARGGDLGYFTAEGKENPSAEVRKAVFAATEQNQVLPTPVKTDQGYAVVYYQSLRPAAKNPEAVNAQIRSRLIQEKKGAAIKALVESLRSKTKVEINEKALASMTAAQPTPAPSTPVSSAPASSTPQ